MGIDPNTKPGAGRDAPRDAPRLGVLMLDTRFPRWPGDVGCDEGFAAAPLRERVAGAVPSEVVTDAEALQRSAFPPAFLQAALRLQAGGAAAVTTSCGFLVLLQAALQGALGVPLVTSALLQLPRLLQAAPRVGVLTVDARRLGHAHLLAAGVPAARLGDVVVEGVDADGPFARPLLANLAQRDFDAAEADLMAAARRLQQRAPDLHQVVLECTNMPPHATALRRATGWQLHGLLDDPALRGFLAPPPAGSRGASASPGPAA
jgi:hypothetical protein